MTGLIPTRASESPDYPGIHSDIVGLLEAARHAAARSVNALMTASYWEIGRRIVEFEQGGQDRAAYGQALLKRLSVDLTTRFGRGFSERNLEQMRLLYLAWPPGQISQTPSAKLAVPVIYQTASGESPSSAISATASRNSGPPNSLAAAFPLPWSAYVWSTTQVAIVLPAPACPPWRPHGPVLGPTARQHGRLARHGPTHRYPTGISPRGPIVWVKARFPERIPVRDTTNPCRDR